MSSAEHALPGKAGTLVTMWRLAKLGRRLAKHRLPAAAGSLQQVTDAVREVAERAREHGIEDVARQLRGVPVQLSIDVAAPLEVAYDEWMQLDSLPEGDHRVEDIERRREGMLRGKIRRLGAVHQWEAEVRDERRDESFAWRSTRGSDVAGLVTFHRLGERLTRVELGLDIVPLGAGEALAFALRISDRVAEADLRRFKLQVETVSPEAYPARVNHAGKRTANRKKQANRQGGERNARTQKSRTKTKEA